MADNVSTFRGRPALSPTANASRWTIWRSRITEAICLWLDRRGAPGAIQSMSYTDALAGQTVTVRVSHFYTVLTVNGRDYYFHRLSGKFDGTGMAV